MYDMLRHFNFNQTKYKSKKMQANKVQSKMSNKKKARKNSIDHSKQSDKLNTRSIC